jgi:hypothetical protein
MKTTLDLSDSLLLRAKRHARKIGKPLRAVVEDGLRRILDDPPKTKRYVLRDCSVGNPRAPNPLEWRTWQDLRDEIYGGR